MAKYTRNVASIEAIQWDGDADKANAFLGESYGEDWEFSGTGPNILLIHGYSRQVVLVGQYIVKTDAGMVYPLSADTFEQSFTKVEE